MIHLEEKPNMSSFEVITGFWKRRSATTNKGGQREEYLYGKPNITEPITLYPGDELYMFNTTANNAARSAPSMFLKVKRASTETGEETDES